MEAALAFDSGLAALRNRGTPMVSLRNLLSFVAGGARLRLGPRRLTQQRDRVSTRCHPNRPYRC